MSTIKSVLKALNAVDVAERKATEAKQALPEHSAAMKAHAAVKAKAFKLFSADKELKAALAAVEFNSKQQFGLDENGDLYAWARYVPKQEYRDNKAILSLLEDYIDNEGYRFDIKNDALINFQGECITINEDGDVFDASKCIIERSDYSTEAERNALIEAHMEQTGCYPGVFKVSRYGNVQLVNTQPKGKAE